MVIIGINDYDEYLGDTVRAVIKGRRSLGGRRKKPNASCL